MKKTIWQPITLGIIFGMLAGITTVTGLSFLTAGISENAIGFYGTLFLLAAAFGGPLAGAIASLLMVLILALFGPPDMKAIITVPVSFWSNLLALGITVALVGFAYRLIFERVKMPVRLLAWAGVIIAYYIVSIPSSIIPQNLVGNTASEILPELLYSYKTYIPQAIFDIFITSLVFIALPASFLRPLWYKPKLPPGQKDAIQIDKKKVLHEN